MFEIKPREKMVERALLVGVCLKPEDPQGAEELLDELGELSRTLGVPVVARTVVVIREPQARLLIGSGKAEEICRLVREHDCDVIIFDNPLTPAQQRNWEALAKVTVIDRQEIILDIFGQRAQTREARIQVDLARMAYSLPRLTRAWSHLGKQGGGIGAKGEGESQLEQDRRKIRGQMDRLRRDLQQVRRARATQRKDRKTTPVPNAAIVGYTNAGKSSLLRRLTQADVLVENQLFATLDTTTRRVDLPNKQALLLTDTVGFVRRLPHELVEAFKATLEEAVQADFLIHLLDASHPKVLDFFDTTESVLTELGATGKPTLVVFNKIDKISDPATRVLLRHRFPEAVFISVHTGEGIEFLLTKISEFVTKNSRKLLFRLPHERGDLLAALHREGEIHDTRYTEKNIEVLATLSGKTLDFETEFSSIWNGTSEA
ncbi:MAG: GTPase HflX [Chthoniobacterales bacterium]